MGVINDFFLATPEALTGLIDRSPVEQTYLGPWFTSKETNSTVVKAEYWEKLDLGLVPVTSHSGPASRLDKGKLSRNIYEPFVIKLYKDWVGEDAFMIHKAMQPGASENMHEAFVRMVELETNDMYRRMEHTKEWLRMQCLKGATVDTNAAPFPTSDAMSLVGTQVNYPDPTTLTSGSWDAAGDLIVSTNFNTIRETARAATGIPISVLLMNNDTSTYIFKNTEIQNWIARTPEGIRFFMGQPDIPPIAGFQIVRYDTATRDTAGAIGTEFLGDDQMLCLPAPGVMSRFLYDLKTDLLVPTAGTGSIGNNMAIVKAPYSFIETINENGLVGFRQNLWDSTFPINLRPASVLYDADIKS